MKRPYSIRTRTAFFIATSFALFLSGFFLLSYLSIRNSLLVRSSGEARAQLQTILTSMDDSAHARSLHEIISSHNVIGEARLSFAVYRRDSTRLTLLPGSALHDPLPLDKETLEKLERDSIATIRNSTTQQSFRLIGMSTPKYFGVAAMDLVVLNEAEDAMLTQFGILLILGIAVSAFLGYSIAGISLAPITLLITAAKKLQSSSHSENEPVDLRRLPVPDSVREVALLASAVNRLIDERETSIAQLRNFTADAAHELRTPLTVLKGELEVELRVTDIAHPSREIFESNLEEVERLITIVEDLLLLAKLDQREGDTLTGAETFSVRQALKSVIGRLEPLARSNGVEIEGWFDEDSDISTLRDRFERMLYNILHNAISYTEPGGTVSIELITKSVPKKIVIRDTGIGIPPEALPHVFERFYRAEKSRSRQGGGAGLGLAIAKSISDQTGCGLTIQSSHGEGSEITITLPLDK